MSLRVDEVIFEPTLKQMSTASVTTVEVAGVTAVEELHSRREIRFRGGQE